ISEKVVGERRVLALRDLGGRLVEAMTVEEACVFAAETLAAYDKDVPFVFFYLPNEDATEARLAAAAGLGNAEAIAPPMIDLREPRPGWPLFMARMSGAVQLVEDLAGKFPEVPAGPWSDPPHRAVVLPIPSSKPQEPAAFMVAGLSSRLRWDPFYRDFFDLARTRVATAIANARAYEEEKRRAEGLAELDRAKTAFFSNVSHEFRTPLTLMLAPIEDLLERSRSGPEAALHGDLEVVHRNGQRLLRLVNTLLDFSRMEAGRTRARYQPTDLAAFTADLASVFRAAVERAGLKLVVECHAPSEPVYVDREMWEKIVLNLLSNAFKFTFHGEIAVTLKERSDRQVELLVRDTGTGIPAGEMPRLFERFHRVHNARGRTHEGSGIGLALVQDLVRQHGGRIGATSRPGEGTTFSVVVPLGSAHLPPEQIAEGQAAAVSGKATTAFVEEAMRWFPDAVVEGQADAQGEVLDDEPAPAAEAGTESAEADDARPLVLIADDNADMRQYLSRLLAGRYGTEVAADGEMALAAVRRRAPDLILTDVMMPRLDGFGLLQRLRQEPDTRHIPVIMLSARAGEESRVVGMEAGVDDYLVKPFSARELLARVSGHLQMARLRREASEAMEESHDRFEALFNAAPIGVYLVDADLRIIQVNPKALPMFGDIENLIGSDFSEVIHVLWPKPYADEIVARFRHTLATGQPYFVPERVEERLDRRVQEYYEWQIHRIALPDGRHGVVCYFSDISRHVMARQALAEADRRKNEFLAVLAHELRNPLAPLRSALQVMKLAQDDPATVKDSRLMMERQLTLLVRLIDDLMDMSRISRGKVELRRERIALSDAVRLAVETSRPEIEARGHEFVVELPSDRIGVDADVDRLAQVFSNLLNNAAKYTDPGGHITLSVQRHGAEAVVRVRDTGMGIPPEMLPKVFDIFTQVDRTIEAAQGGLGIGLSLVKGLVEMHGGTVEARSEGRGKGSEFVVQLPVRSLEAEKQRSDWGGATTRIPSRRVLIVDDNRDAAVSLAAMLNFMGNETQTAHDGYEALDVAASFRPDLVMLDIGMPRLSGYDTARRIREQPWGRGMVLVALTGWGQEEDRRKSKDAGFDSHLVKPIEPGAMERLLAGLPRPPGPHSAAATAPFNAPRATR
ncbi:MAG TPA: ATP-binding protein, partial [Candidatus Polarisedimenticolia bacterium]|nr:ATP-binding protein [Candidatus Polarisedimenticolia bacterium]